MSDVSDAILVQELGIAYKYGVIQGSHAKAISYLVGRFQLNPDLATSAQKMLSVVDDTLKDRDFVTKMNSTFASAALAQI